jgi:hypothetical protein
VSTHPVFSLGGAAATGDEAATGVDAAAGVVAGGGCWGVLGRFLAGASFSSDSREERLVAGLFSAGCSFLISTTFGSGLLERMSSLPLSTLLSKLGMSSTSSGCKFKYKIIVRE